MEKEKMEEWLSTLANAAKTLIKNRNFSGDIFTTYSDKAVIHVYTGLRKVAESLELELHERPWKCDGATATYIHFEYEGVTFYELENYTVGEA
jgi:hypothetical protein